MAWQVNSSTERQGSKKDDIENCFEPCDYPVYAYYLKLTAYMTDYHPRKWSDWDLQPVPHPQITENDRSRSS